jgi:hypothetical protein
MNNLIMHLQLLEKQEQIKLKTSRWREIIKSGTKVNEIETTPQRINEKKHHYLKRLARLTNP